MLVTLNYKNGEVETDLNEYEWESECVSVCVCVCVCVCVRNSAVIRFFFLITKKILVCTKDNYSL